MVPVLVIFFVLATIGLAILILPQGVITRNVIRNIIFAAIGAGIGIAIGTLLNNTILKVALGAVGLAVPIWYGQIMSRTGQRNDDEQLETTLSIITATYVQSQDLLTSVKNNLSRIPAPFHSIFEGFLTGIDTVDPSVKNGLMRIRMMYDHPRWREWIDACAQCQDDRSLVYILPPIVADLGDARRMEMEVATVISSAWRDYLIIAAIGIGQIPLIKYVNEDWYRILTETLAGQIIVAIMFASVAISAFIVWKINKPIQY